MENIEYIYDLLESKYGNYPKTELAYHNPFQLLLAVLMSAQTTDVQVNKMTAKLRDKILCPSDVIRFGLSNLIVSISGINYYITKANNIYKLSEMVLSSANQKKWKNKIIANNFEKIFSDYGFVLPCDLSDLIELPGVGIKTAMVFANIIFGLSFVAVDTHVHRVCNRIGLLDTDRPEQTSEILNSKLQFKYKSDIHHFLIYHGRYVCKSLSPDCENCVLKSHCKRYESQSKQKS